MSKNKTLLLGNGFSRAVYNDIPSWAEFFSPEASKNVSNYPILYEMEFYNQNQKEEGYKSSITDKLTDDKLVRSMRDLHGMEQFGDDLRRKGVGNILTTNYDNGVALLLCNKCGYKEVQNESGENMYSIRRYRTYECERTNHRLKVWKIHGDISKPKTIQLGLDQYGGFLDKIIEYVNKGYSYGKDKKIKLGKIEDRLKEKNFDVASWIDLFFLEDIYIIGFGMGFEEVDLWWLLTKRARIKKETNLIKNKIHYVSRINSSNKEKNIEVREALSAFGIDTTLTIDTNETYLRGIVEVLQKR